MLGRTSATVMACMIVLAAFQDAAMAATQASFQASIAAPTRSTSSNASSCSGSYSSDTPPASIRILYDFAGGDSQVHTVDFRTYVQNVLPNEWLSGWTQKSYQTGAMMVMTYGWWHVNNWSGGTANGQCFDVDSTTSYQVYVPNSATTWSIEAVNSIFAASRMYRRPAGGYSDIFEARYIAGSISDQCGQLSGGSANGWQGSQWGTQACGAGNLNWPAIVRRYYFDNTFQPGVITILDDAPAATNYVPPGMDSETLVYALDRGGNVSQNQYMSATQSFGSWSTGSVLGGNCSSSPGSTASGPYQLWIFCRRSSANDGAQAGAIVGNHNDGSSWSGFTLVNGDTTGVQGSPAAVDFYYQGINRIYLWVLGWDGNIYVKIYDNSSWSSYIPMGSPPGGCTSSPNSDYTYSTNFYAFCRATDGLPWYTMWNGSGWSAWTQLLGQTSYSAVAIGRYENSSLTWQVNIALMSENGAYQNYMVGTNNQWQGWSFWGCDCQSAPDLSYLYSAPQLFLFARWQPGTQGTGYNGWIAYREWNGSQWLDWVSLYGP